MRSRLYRFTVPLVLLLAVGLGACGDDDDDGETATPAATPTPSASPTRLPFDATPTPTPPPATTEALMEVKEFTILPGTTRARPGTVVFNVRNTGDITHQFLVVRSDLPIAQLPRKPGDAGADETQVDVVGRIDEIPAGESGEVSVPVETGSYVLICNLFADGVSHYLSGMYRLFEVTPSAPEPQPSPTQTPSPSP